MKTIRLHLIAFAALLVLSGITAFPVQQEIDFLFRNKDVFPGFMMQWIAQLHGVIAKTPELMLYGTDWLAFAHIIIALFFVPVYLHPQRYKTNVLVGIAACLLVFPLAFICGPARGIPFFHQLIDCAFGLLGGLYLYYILKKINRLTPTT